MGLTELFILAVGLSMDAFAVAVCKGLAMPKVTWKKITAVGLWFGGFQALMPAAGYFLGIRFKDGITAIDPLDRVYTAFHHRNQYDPRSFLRRRRIFKRPFRLQNDVPSGCCDKN